MPEPLTAIHACVVDAAHAHPLEVPTVMLPVPPTPVIVRLVGVNRILHAMPACVTVNVREAIVRVPDRVDVLGLAATLKPADPLPLPLAPLVIVIQLAFETAVHVQPVPAVTPTLPVVTPAPTDCPVELMDGAQDCVNEKPFDAELPVEPPGPIAMTRASNTTLGAGALCRSGRKSTRMTPPLGAGLPRSMVSNGTEDPTTNTESEYRWTSGVPSPARVL